LDGLVGDATHQLGDELLAVAGRDVDLVAGAVPEGVGGLTAFVRDVDGLLFAGDEGVLAAELEDVFDEIFLFTLDALVLASRAGLGELEDLQRLVAAERLEAQGAGVCVRHEGGCSLLG
jgi:hypothetical protein